MSVTPLRTIKAECHAATVQLFRLLLERAEAGQIVGACISVDCGDHYESISTVEGRAQAIGMLEMAKMRILEEDQ